MIESRAKANLKKKAYHNIVLAVVGVIALIAILIFFGTKILIGFSLLTENGDSGQTNSKKTDVNTYVAPPTLNPVADATKESTITVSGKGLADQRVKLYVNESFVDETTTQDDNNFNFPSVHLNDGQNTIKAMIITKENAKSAFSKEVTISYLNKPPELSINQPQDGQGFDKSTGPVSILGQTDPNAQVTVNDFTAVVDDQGKFSYLYNLKDGDNDIKVVATDKANNNTTKEFHIHTN